MESPVFKLEKVVHSRSEEMQDFEGPLDLILFLLGKNKLEIQDISISLICGQYIAWLEDRQRMDLEVASEFVIMASHLVYLKTRMLLSIHDEEVLSEMEQLIAKGIGKTPDFVSDVGCAVAINSGPKMLGIGFLLNEGEE